LTEKKNIKLFKLQKYSKVKLLHPKKTHNFT